MTNRVIISIATAAYLLVATSAKADLIAETTLSFPPATLGPPVDHTFDALVIDWSTSAMSGVIDESNLTNLSFTLTNGGSTVYQDTVIVNSVIQPIGGAVRTVIDFNFDIDALPNGLGVFSNDVALAQASASGITYSMEKTVSTLDLFAYDDGALTDGAQFLTFSQATVVVPEPSAFLYIGLVGIGIVTWKKLKLLGSGS